MIKETYVILFVLISTISNCYSQISKENVIFTAGNHQKPAMNLKLSWVIGQIGIKKKRPKVISQENLESDYSNEGEIKIFPNPTNDMIYVTSLTSKENKLIYLYDLMGNVLQTKTIVEGVTSSLLDVCQYANGTYIIKIVINKKSSKYVRIIKE